MTMTRLLCVLSGCLLAGVLAGCLGRGPRTSDDDVATMRYESLRELLSDEDEDVLLVDPRTAAAFATGHIPDAVNIPLPTMVKKDPRLADAEHIVVYAAGWTDPLAIAAAKRLLALEYENISHFPGGLELWAESGGRVATIDAESMVRPETGR